MRGRAVSTFPEMFGHRNVCIADPVYDGLFDTLIPLVETRKDRLQVAHRDILRETTMYLHFEELKLRWFSEDHRSMQLIISWRIR